MRKIKITLGIISLIITGAFFLLPKIGSLIGNFIVGEPKTEANIPHHQFPRFNLPSTATNIGYRENRYQFVANFNIPEEDFKKVFSDYNFEEITQATPYSTWNFDAPNFDLSTKARRHSTENGLIHAELEPDGGGYLIIFDRNKELVSIDYTTH